MREVNERHKHEDRNRERSKGAGKLGGERRKEKGGRRQAAAWEFALQPPCCFPRAPLSALDVMKHTGTRSPSGHGASLRNSSSAG